MLFLTTCINVRQYQNSNINDNFKVLKRYARDDLYSLESLLIE